MPAKAEFNNLTDGEKTLFKNGPDYLPAKDRYEEWAKFNNDADPYDGYNDVHTKISALLGTFRNNDNAETTTITVIVSLISTLAVGGFFFIRRKKIVK